MKTSIYLGVILSALLSFGANATTISYTCRDCRDGSGVPTLTNITTAPAWIYSGTGTQIRAIEEFDLSGMSLGFTYTLAVDWQNHILAGRPKPEQFSIYTYEADGIITSGDFFNGSFFGAYSTDTSSIDLTTLIVSSIVNNQDFLGINLRVTGDEIGPTRGGWSQALNGMEICSSATCSVSPVPIPATAWLFGSALLGLFGIGGMRKNAA